MKLTVEDIKSDIESVLLRMAARPGMWGNPKTYEASRLAVIAIWDVCINNRCPGGPIWNSLWDEECLRLHRSSFGTLADESAPVQIDLSVWKPVYQFVLAEMRQLFIQMQSRAIHLTPWSNGIASLFEQMHSAWPVRFAPIQVEEFLLQLLPFWFAYAVKDKRMSPSPLKDALSLADDIPPPPSLEVIETIDEFSPGISYHNRLRKLIQEKGMGHQLMPFASIAQREQGISVEQLTSPQINNYEENLRRITDKMRPIESQVINRRGN